MLEAPPYPAPLPLGGLLLHSRQQPIDQGKGMRRAFMFIQNGIATYLEDMTLEANVELGD
jgi:hypothetical protein